MQFSEPDSEVDDTVPERDPLDQPATDETAPTDPTDTTATPATLISDRNAKNTDLGCMSSLSTALSNGDYVTTSSCEGDHRDQAQAFDGVISDWDHSFHCARNAMPCSVTYTFHSEQRSKTVDKVSVWSAPAHPVGRVKVLYFDSASQRFKDISNPSTSGFPVAAVVAGEELSIDFNPINTPAIRIDLFPHSQSAHPYFAAVSEIALYNTQASSLPSRHVLSLATADVSSYLPGTTLLSVETKVGFTVETYPQWDSIENDEELVREQTFRYTLELDDNNNIIGGEYESDSPHRPDFVWFAPIPEFSGYYKALGTLYDESVGYTGWSLPEMECDEPSIPTHYTLNQVSDTIVLKDYPELTTYSWSLAPVIPSTGQDGQPYFYRMCSSQCMQDVCLYIKLNQLLLAGSTDVFLVYEGAECTGEKLVSTHGIPDARGVLVQGREACMILLTGPRDFRWSATADNNPRPPVSLQVAYDLVTPCRA